MRETTDIPAAAVVLHFLPVISGGRCSSPHIVDTSVSDGRHLFFAVSKRNQALCHFLFGVCAESRPWKDNLVIHHLKSLRN